MGRQRQQGFTLLEALVAISIFAVIGVASYQVLSAVIDAKQGLSESQQHLAGQQMAMQILERDIRQLASRDVRQVDALVPYLVVEEKRITFTRHGLANPLGLPRSDMQRLTYDIGVNPWQGEPGHPLAGQQGYFLRRILSSALDTASDETSIQLLFPAQAMAVIVVSQNQKYTNWPPAGRGADDVNRDENADVARPDGIYITVELATGQQLSRWLKVF